MRAHARASSKRSEFGNLSLQLSATRTGTQTGTFRERSERLANHGIERAFLPEGKIVKPEQTESRRSRSLPPTA